MKYIKQIILLFVALMNISCATSYSISKISPTGKGSDTIEQIKYGRLLSDNRLHICVKGVQAEANDRFTRSYKVRENIRKKKSMR